VSNFQTFANYQSVTDEDANSVNADPQFVNLAATPPDLEIQSTSPAFQAGSAGLSCSVGWCDPNGSSPNFIYGATDLLGNPRVTSGNINIGAYESTGANNTLTVTLAAGAYTLQPGQSTTLTANVSANPGGAGVPSGTISFMLGSNLLQTSTLLPTRVVTSAVSLPLSAAQLAQGINTLTAVYSGNSISPCCNPKIPPDGGNPIPVYPSVTSAPITLTVQP
jgi:hypothetical protein